MKKLLGTSGSAGGMGTACSRNTGATEVIINVKHRKLQSSTEALEFVVTQK